MIAVAPMMGYTDRHFRYLLRLISPHAQLYTEMMTTQMILCGDKTQHLAFHPAEKYVALQLGGSDPKALASCARIGESYGYNEINLNVGCPSPRVSSGRFGACLMLEPALVAECVAEMNASVRIPVTVKCRIGVDEQEEYAALHHFVSLMEKAGCTRLIIHARKAWLKGLSPKENRDIPPLCYETVYRIKQNFPSLSIIINGGIKTLFDIQAHLKQVDGVMLGRAICAAPYLLADIEAAYFPHTSILSRAEVLKAYFFYMRSQLKNKVRLHAMARHLLGLFAYQPGANRWRRYLSENLHKINLDQMEEVLFLK